MNKVRDVRLILNKIQQTRHQQQTDIDQTEQQVIDDIKLFGLNLITEVSKTCKQLIHETTTICNQARTQFTDKYEEREIQWRVLIAVHLFRNNRFEQYLQNMDHSLDFVNEALTNGRIFEGRNESMNVCLRFENRFVNIESSDDETIGSFTSSEYHLVKSSESFSTIICTS